MNEDDPFDLQLVLEDASVDQFRAEGRRLRPMVTPANWRLFVAPVLGALAQSSKFNEKERTDRFVAFAVALGLEGSDVISVLKEWEELQKDTP
jgi:hypothetical protein